MQDWYPSEQQVDSPERLRATFKQVLQLHYDLAAEHNDLKRRVAEMPLPARTTTTVNPPAGTVLLGLPVGPVDTTSLADGTKLTYSKAQRMFIFK